MKFSELVDISKLRDLCAGFTSITGAVTAILDLEGNILTATGWQDICTRFHRGHHAAAGRCRESDTVLAGRLREGERYKVYKCQNGLIDVAVPITIGGEHVANFFTGQFFFEPPDKEYYIWQAEEFGFDKGSYIEALDKVPIFSEDKVLSMMGFLTRLAQLICEMALTRENLEETNAELRKHQEHLEQLVMERTTELSRANREFQAEIAECKRTEEALRRSEQKFSLAFQATPSILVIASLADGRYVEVNETFERVVGYRREEVIGLSSLELNIWQNREDRANVLLMLSEGKKVRDLEMGFRSKSGTVLAGLYSAEIIEIGAEQCLLSLFNDITARIKAEEELRASEEALRVIFNSSHDAIFIHELDGTIIDFNDKMLEMYGVDRHTAITLTIADHYSCPDNPLNRLPVIWEMVVAGENQFFEWRARRIDDNTIFDVEVSLCRIILNKRYAILATVRDITARKRAKEEIERLNTDLAARAAELEAANEELEAFNYTVAHDLRQPLNNIGINCQAIHMLYGDQLQEECKAYVQNAYSATLRMHQLIKDLLNFSHLAHLEPRRETVDFSSVARAVTAELAHTEPARRVEYRIAEGITVIGDAHLLRVVLENLLGNAWKYTGTRDEGIIEFGTTEVNGKPAYLVRDNGLGFDMADTDKLFTPFKRLAEAEEFGGHGIGLATVARVIQRHGGRIWAEGEKGKGATFYFTLPE